MKKLFLCILIISFICLSTYSQSRSGDDKVHHFDFGLGFGYEYGAMGMQAKIAPISRLAFFGGVGYFYRACYNVGADFYIIPKTSKRMIRPFVEAMYGYNLLQIILYENYALQSANIYYGPSVALGVELRFGKKRRHGINLYFPRVAIWSEDAWDAYNNASDDNKSALGPVGGSLGYHIEF